MPDILRVLLGHAPGLPSGESCSDIFGRSDPPTNPMTTFFRSSFNRSSISLETSYSHVKPPLAASAAHQSTHLPGWGEGPINVKQDKLLDGSVSERGHNDGEGKDVETRAKEGINGDQRCNLAPSSAPNSLMQSGYSNNHPQRSFPPLYTSVGDAAADRLAFFHTLERLKVRYGLVHINQVT